MQCDPQVKALLDKAASANVPGPESLSAEQARELYKRSRLPTQPIKPEVDVCRDIELQVPGHNIPVREYRPLGMAQSHVLPALIYFHGGGWVVGDLDTHDTLCRELSNFAGCAVFSVNYRKAPEHRFPAALDDAIAATHYLFSHAAAMGIDVQRMTIGGDSAGANLATVVAQQYRTNPVHRLILQLLVYPVTDLRLQTTSFSEYASGYGLTAAAMRYFRDTYLHDDKHILDPRASPLLAPDLTGMPKTLVLTAGFDPLRDEGRAYADAMSAAGNAVQYVCFERQIHGFLGMGGMVDEANTAVRLCADFLRQGWR
jgi:acetyl esterase